MLESGANGHSLIELLARYRDRGGFVYLLHSEEIDRVKIGHSETNPKERVRVIQTASPVRLNLVALLQGGAALERELHRRFASSRIRGEWFDLSPEVRDLMSTAAVVSEEQERARLEMRLARFNGDQPYAPPSPEWIPIQAAAAMLNVPTGFFRDRRSNFLDARGDVSVEELQAFMCRCNGRWPDLEWLREF